MTTLTVPARFNGPPDSGNGGYTCGLMAAQVEGAVTVELRAPPPLDTPMPLRVDDGVTTAWDGDVLVARAIPGDPLEIEVPDPVSVEQAREASRSYVGFDDHAFPTCFVCGPGRPDDDGLGIYTGRVAGRSLGAAPWRPTPDLAGADGHVDPLFVWSALDCPAHFGSSEDVIAVLASMSVRQLEPVPVDDDLVVIGWKLERDGRKIWAGSAIQDADGQTLAVSRSLWIVVDRP